MDLRTIIETLGPVVLTTLNVGLWTLRVTLAATGRRLLAAAVASAEAVLFTLAFGTVVSSFDDPARIGAYAVGVGAGTLAGLAAEQRLHRPLPVRRRAVYGGPARPHVTCATHEGVLP